MGYKEFKAKEGCCYSTKAKTRISNAIRELKAIRKESPLYYDSDIQQAISILNWKR